MKIDTKCIICLLGVRESELERISGDSELRLKYMVEIMDCYSELLKRGVKTPAEASTELFRCLKGITGVEDPRRHEKKVANTVALKVYRDLKKKLAELNEKSRLKLAVRASLVGNAIDLGVAGYSFNLESIYSEILSLKLAVDDSWIFEQIEGLEVVFLLDNCGEAVLDRLLAEELEKRGARTTAIVKGGSFQNDITIKESDMAGLNESFSRVISTGTDGASVFLDEISEECKSAIFEADLIVSKGMAHFEYLDEIRDRIRKKIVFMLRAKCTPVAEALKVPLKSYVVKLI